MTDEDSLFDAPPMAEQERMVEAILFAMADPVTMAELTARLPHGADAAEALVHLRKRYAGRGVTLVRVGLPTPLGLSRSVQKTHIARQARRSQVCFPARSVSSKYYCLQRPRYHNVNRR